MSNQLTFTKQRHPDYPKMGTKSLTVDVIDGVYCYAHIADCFSPLGVRIVPPSVLKDYNVGLPARQQEMCDIARQGFLDDARERMSNHVPTEEEKYEMRAAFGEGATVVNVITGKKYEV